MLGRLDQSQIAVLAAIQDAHGVSVRVAEHDERLASFLDPQRGILHRHRLDGVARRADDSRRERRVCRRRRYLARARPAPLPLRPLALELVRLLLDFFGSLPKRQVPGVTLAEAP